MVLVRCCSSMMVTQDSGKKVSQGRAVVGDSCRALVTRNKVLAKAKSSMGSTENMALVQTGRSMGATHGRGKVRCFRSMAVTQA